MGGVQRLGKIFGRGEISTDGVENTVRNGGGKHCLVGNMYMYVHTKRVFLLHPSHYANILPPFSLPPPPPSTYMYTHIHPPPSSSLTSLSVLSDSLLLFLKSLHPLPLSLGSLGIDNIHLILRLVVHLPRILHSRPIVCS